MVINNQGKKEAFINFYHDVEYDDDDVDDGYLVKRFYSQHITDWSTNLKLHPGGLYIFFHAIVSALQ